MTENITTINEIQNDMYFGREVLNRVSFLRENSTFINLAVNHSNARFIFFSNTDPLVVDKWQNKLVMMTNDDNQLKTSDPMLKGIKNLPSWKTALDQWCQDNSSHHHGLRDNEQPTILFMGIEDESVGLDTSSANVLDYQDGRYKGIPYFAVDLTQSPILSKDIVDLVKLCDETIQLDDITFSTLRKHTLGFSHFEASLFSQAKMFIDWLARNKFCPGCGSKVIPIHAGGKLKCTNEKTVGTKENGKPAYNCPVRNVSVSNVSFPRTDAVIITAVTTPDRSKMLLSLSKRFKMAKMYSCTSGFMEPAETVEVATKREIWEETGVACSKINIVMTQPWPFPGNLMIGCVAEVEFNGENEKIDLDHDNELEDARWFDTKFIKNIVYPENAPDGFNPEGILVPMEQSIAYSLIKLVVDEELHSKL